MTDEIRGHRILIYKDGKLVGGLGSKGMINRLQIHQVMFTKAKAEEVAAEINADTSEEMVAYTAKVRPFLTGGK